MPDCGHASPGSPNGGVPDVDEAVPNGIQNAMTIGDLQQKPLTCMNIRKPRIRPEQSAFTLVEVLVAVSIIGFLFVALYLGFASGFGLIEVDRENLRAVQILQEKMETIRLYNWDQINTPGFIPSTFVAPFFATNTTTTSSGFTYSGTVTITNAPIAESYSNALRLVIVKVQWQSGTITRSREMETYITRYGLQNYVY